LLFMQQETTRPQRIVSLARSGVIGRNVGIEQDGLAAFGFDVGFAQLDLPGAHRLNFAAHQGDTRLKPVFQEVIVAGLAIIGHNLEFFRLLIGGHGVAVLSGAFARYWSAASSSGSAPALPGCTAIVGGSPSLSSTRWLGVYQR